MVTGATTDGVVVHLPENDRGRQEAVLRNVVNLLRVLGPSTTIEVVTHGPGVTLATGETGLGPSVIEVQQLGAVVCACTNTLQSRRLTKEALLPGVTVVPSGVAHLVERQRQGWAYLRP